MVEHRDDNVENEVIEHTKIIHEYRTDITFIFMVCTIAVIVTTVITSLLWKWYIVKDYSIIQSNKVSTLLDTYYGDNKPDKDKLESLYVQSVIDSIGDRYTYYVSGDTAESIDNELNSIMCGIGVRVIPGYDGIQIVRVMENSPAEMAGLYKGLIITEVNDNKVDLKEYNRYVEMISGTDGTYVKLKTYDINSLDEHTYNIQRKTIVTENAYYENVDDTDYIRIESFSKGVSEQFKKCIERVTSEGNGKGIIIDLRGNTGGMLDEVISIGDILMDNVKLITTVRSNGDIEDIKLNDGTKFIGSIVVLTDGLTASASEILTGSLRDNVGAKVVGTRTYGKGVVCDYIKYNDGTTVTVTSGEYKLPKGESINNIGIQPDYKVSLQSDTYNVIYTLDTERDNQLSKAIQVLKEQ